MVAYTPYANAAKDKIVIVAWSPPILCLFFPSSGKSSSRTRLRMLLYSGESFGLGDFATASTGNPSSLGNILKRAVATSGRK